MSSSGRLCRHEMNPDWCAACNPPEDPRPQRVGEPTEAKYVGKCTGCGDRIAEGDPIYPTEMGWVDQACAERATNQ